LPSRRAIGRRSLGPNRIAVIDIVDVIGKHVVRPRREFIKLGSELNEFDIGECWRDNLKHRTNRVVHVVGVFHLNGGSKFVVIDKHASGNDVEYNRSDTARGFAWVPLQ
jgi:hypothetical protein